MLAEPKGCLRVFVDEGPPFTAILVAGKQEFSVASSTYVDTPLEVLGDQTGDQTRRLQPLVEPLTDREIEALHLLSSGLSN